MGVDTLFLDHFPPVPCATPTTRPPSLATPVVVSLSLSTSRLYRMSSSGSEPSSSDSEVGTSAQALPQRGTTLASKRKGAFEPPPGAVLVSGGPGDGPGATEMGEFDWNSVKDDGIELWLVRVPISVCLLLKLFLSSAGLASGSGLVLHGFRGPLAVEWGALITPEPHLRSKISHTPRSNPSISTTPFSMPLPRLPRTLWAKSSGNTRHTTCGLSVTVTIMMLITTRLAATR